MIEADKIADSFKELGKGHNSYKSLERLYLAFYINLM